MGEARGSGRRRGDHDRKQALYLARIGRLEALRRPPAGGVHTTGSRDVVALDRSPGQLPRGAGRGAVHLRHVAWPVPDDFRSADRWPDGRRHGCAARRRRDHRRSAPLVRQPAHPWRRCRRPAQGPRRCCRFARGDQAARRRCLRVDDGGRAAGAGTTRGRRYRDAGAALRPADFGRSPSRRAITCRSTPGAG